MEDHHGVEMVMRKRKGCSLAEKESQQIGKAR
jgi:hypothetical protein